MEIRRDYNFRDLQSDFTKILLDLETGQKLFFTGSGKMFSLSSSS